MAASYVPESSDGTPICAICMDSMLKDGSAVLTKGACGHVFHQDCIAKWLALDKTACPFCCQQFRGIRGFPVAPPAAWEVPGFRGAPPPVETQQRANGESPNPMPEELLSAEHLATPVTPLLAIETRTEFSVVTNAEIDLAGIVAVSVPATPNAQRTSVDLVCVCDVSASMAGNRLETLKSTVVSVYDHLMPSDRIAVVAFSDRAWQTTPLMRATAENRATFESMVHQMRVENLTNIARGIALATTILNARQTKNPVSSVFLFTDGHDNAHNTARGISFLVRDTTLYTFGIGRRHAPRFLNELAARCHGTFTFVATGEAIAGCVGSVLGGVIATCAKKITVTLSAQQATLVVPPQSIYYREDVGFGETCTVYFRLRLPAIVGRATTEVLIVDVVYETLDGQLRRLPEPRRVFVERAPPEEIQLQLPDEAVDEERNRLVTVQALLSAGDGRSPAAVATLRSAEATVRGTRAAAREGSRSAALADMLARVRLDAADEFATLDMTSSVNAQRGGTAYSSGWQTAMRAAMSRGEQ